MKTNDLSNCYQNVLTDLAYSQTHYPNSRITFYLNDLARKIHGQVYSQRLFMFYKVHDLIFEDVPMIMAKSWRETVLSFALLVIFTVAGIILAVMDESNVVKTLGPEYVDMTLENIKNGVPTNVYSMGSCESSFVRIWVNNLGVAAKMFAAGFIPYLGPIYFMKVNGVMLGEFQTLFFLHDCGLKSMSAIWIHGTLEILSMVIECAAAITLGKGWIFPGTYSRVEAVKRSGASAVRILISTFPIITAAALLEGYVTRHVEWPLAVKLLIMLLSLSFMLYYYIYLPYQKYKLNKCLES
ncbi:MAG: stage II sporulation protein M [Paludibacteraceae bacterium]|nr:stage II sporulation protein M [Paludibacteraceae bacterium]